MDDRGTENVRLDQRGAGAGAFFENAQCSVQRHWIAYLGERVDGEGKGRRGPAICTEVERSRNPAKFSIRYLQFDVITMYLGKRPPVRGSGKGSRGGG